MADTIAYYAPTTGGPEAASIDPFTFTATFAPLVVQPDLIPPAITNVSPAEGTALDAGQLVRFDVTDEQYLALVIVYARFLSADPLVPDEWEVIWDGFDFAPRYAPFSSREAIVVGVNTGHRYFVARKDGWPSAPRINIVAIDKGANVP